MQSPSGFVVRGVDRLRFRRAALAKKNGHRQPDVGRHLEKLALPVLGGRLEKVRRSDVLRERERAFRVIAPVVVLVLPPGDGLAEPAQQEEKGERDREAVVAPYSSKARGDRPRA